MTSPTLGDTHPGGHTQGSLVFKGGYDAHSKNNKQAQNKTKQNKTKQKNYFFQWAMHAM